MAKQINEVGIGRMRNEEHSGFVEQCLQKFSLLPKEKATAQQAALTAAAEAENELLETARGSVSTEALTEADRWRDVCWNGIRMFLVAMLTFPQEAIQAAAKRIQAILDTYGDPRSMPYLQENGAIDNLVRDLETESAAADLELIHTAHWVPELKKYNEEFIKLFDARTAANAAKINGAIRKARLVTDAAYRQLVQIVNALAVMEGDSAYLPFIDSMNELIDYQSSVFARRSTLAAKSPKDEE